MSAISNFGCLAKALAGALVFGGSAALGGSAVLPDFWLAAFFALGLGDGLGPGVWLQARVAVRTSAPTSVRDLLRIELISSTTQTGDSMNSVQ
jgi:hypothetical protein